jgi:4'-phosphopantetheinyl transferase
MSEVYILNISEWKKVHTLLQEQELLSPEKKERLKRLVPERERYHLLCGDWLIRQVLSKRTGGVSGMVRYGYGKFGKPFLIDHPAIHFSLAHSGEFIAAAFSDTPVGIDLEEIKDDPHLADTAKVFMSPEEYRHFTSLSGDARLQFFYRTWTAKESYLKYTGEGLVDALQGIHIRNKDAILSVERGHQDISGVLIRECSISTDYACFICGNARKMDNVINPKLLPALA